MRRLNAARIGIDQGTEMLFSDFEHDGEMWIGRGPREARLSVRFSEGFLSPPVVQLAVSMWDLDHATNQRGDLAAEDVTEMGFDIVFRTWSDSRVARIRCDWLAIGEVADEDTWDV